MAGGYAIQGLASSLICSINGSFTNVIGLPMYELSNLIIEGILTLDWK